MSLQRKQLLAVETTSKPNYRLLQNYRTLEWAQILYKYHSHVFCRPVHIPSCYCGMVDEQKFQPIPELFSWYTLPHCWHRYSQIKQRSESNDCNCIPFLLHCSSFSKRDILPWTIRQGLKKTDSNFGSFILLRYLHIANNH